MSMLVGVRGQTRESEGAALCEGIIQQPGPFYNGNPSSVIWGNSPTTPLWREETASSISATTASSSCFSVSKQHQHVQMEEKGKVGAGMVTGEGRAFSKGRRHVTRAQLGRNLNPYTNAPPSSAFAYGFPPQPPPGSCASLSAPGLVQSRMPCPVASGRNFAAFRCNSNTAHGVSDMTGTAASTGLQTGAIPNTQDERMEDIEEVIPAMAHLRVNHHPRNLKFSVKPDELATRSGVPECELPSWTIESQVSAKFSTLGLNKSKEPSVNRKHVPGLFVFGAKPASKESGDFPEKPSFLQPPPPARSRPLKVKRSVSAVKGKGIAAGNGAFSTQPPSSVGLHVENSQFAGGECSFSQLTPGLGIPAVDNADCTSGDSSFQGFVSSFSVPTSLPEEDSVSEAAHQLSAGVQSPSRSGHNNSVIGEIAKGGFDVKKRLQLDEELSADLALKLGLGSGGAKNAERRDVDKPGKPFSREARSFRKDFLAVSNMFPLDAKIGEGIQDGDGLQSSSSSPTANNTAEFSRAEKESRGEPHMPAFLLFAQAQGGPDAIHAPHGEPFVFGALRPQPSTSSTSTGTGAAVAPSPLFQFVATDGTPSLSPRSNIGGGGSKTAGTPSTSDLFIFKHKGLAAAFSSSSTIRARAFADGLPASFSSFNLGAAEKIPVMKDAAGKYGDSFSSVKKLTVPVPSFAIGAANAKDDSDDNSSYVSADSWFVFSAGSGSPGSSQSTAQTVPKRAAVTAATGAEQRFKENNFSTETNVASDFFEDQSSFQHSNTCSKSFEFHASSSNCKNAARRKTNRIRALVPKRQIRSTASLKEKNKSISCVNLFDTSGTAKEAGSPMDFSPQRYTPPVHSSHVVGQTANYGSWGNCPSMEKDGLDGDDEWAEYSEADVSMNLRDVANDSTLESKQEGRSTWEGIGKGEDESFWWGGKENSPGRSRKWKRSVFNESQVPFSGKDNTWADFKVGTLNEPDRAATSSTRSVNSSVTSSGWGHFTFTAGSSSSFSSATSFLRRHAHKIQQDRPLAGSTEGPSTASCKAEEELASHAGLNVGVVGNSSTASSNSSTMKRPVYVFDSQGNPPVEAGQGSDGRGANWEPLRVPSVMFPSRSSSWSTESAMGSLWRSDGAGLISPQTAGAAAIEQVCERWRLRGNQAYANGDFPKAEEYYSRGASSIPPNETSQSCIRASMLCYSNRAATRMVVGRIREALADCMRAMAVDPNFLRVRLRAASCHLALGETEPAGLAFKECIRRSKEDHQPDLKVSSEASEGLRKALQVEEYLGRASEILANWSSGDTPTALRLLNEVILSSPHSEQALELKARALLILRRYDEVVQLCEQTLETAHRNHPPTNGDCSINQLLQAASGGGSDTGAASPLKIWRWQLTAKAKFHLGKLEEALGILPKLDEMASTATHDQSSPIGKPLCSDPLALSIASIRDLLRHKVAGNDAFQIGKHSEAVEHYSAALACNGDSRPFNAVCFCNRAAASQALGNIGDAIADCSRAIALDPKYAKAISRRATLHEKVRDYGQSCHDLQRLITLLEGQQQQSRVTLSPSRGGRSTTNMQQDLRQARDRLSKAEDEMKKGHPLDHYLILGLEPGCSSNEIKKAYRKAALRHHPDKAGQFLSRSEGGDDGGWWKEVADEVRRDAERLFKLIGEANAILSDTQKRTRYDAEEEFRKLRTRSTTAAGGFAEMYQTAERGQGGAGRRPRDRYDSWNGYSHQYQRWQSGPDAAQPDTYARRGHYGSNNSSRSNGDGGRWNDYDWDDI